MPTSTYDDAAAAARPSAETIRAWQGRKFGLFIHWGLYAIAGGMWQGQRISRGYSEQIMAGGDIPGEDYAKLAAQFNPTAWDPDAVAQLAKAAGMRFVVLTAKHHDGFSLFATRQSDYNVIDATPYARDIVADLAAACRRQGLPFGVYFSTIDWHYPGATGIDRDPTGEPRNDNLIPPAHEEFNVAQLVELTTRYGSLCELWFDMGRPTPAQSRRFAETVHQAQPECLVSGRVFNHQGDFAVMGDNEIPAHLLDEPWQTPASMFHETWGYRSWQERGDVTEKAAEHLRRLVAVVSRGGNYLLNIGPRGDGSVVEFEAAVLRTLGYWLATNGEAIYDAEPQPFRQLAFGHATVKPGRLYLLVTDWPADGLLVLPGLRTPLTKAWRLADPMHTPLACEVTPTGIEIRYEDGPATPPVTVIVAEYEGTLEVTPPALQPTEQRVIQLPQDRADLFYNTNGEGYYQPPTIRRLRWYTAVRLAAAYRLELSLPAGCGAADVTVGGQACQPGQRVTLPESDAIEVAVTPREGWVRSTTGVAVTLSADLG